eukprot:15440338-Alexandrium_andersonii.AAC.1
MTDIPQDSNVSALSRLPLRDCNFPGRKPCRPDGGSPRRSSGGASCCPSADETTMLQRTRKTANEPALTRRR